MQIRAESKVTGRAPTSGPSSQESSRDRYAIVTGVPESHRNATTLVAAVIITFTDTVWF